jgi:hypothetical protein
MRSFGRGAAGGDAVLALLLRPPRDGKCAASPSRDAVSIEAWAAAYVLRSVSLATRAADGPRSLAYRQTRRACTTFDVRCVDSRVADRKQAWRCRIVRRRCRAGRPTGYVVTSLLLRLRS